MWSCTISIATACCCIDLNDVAALHGGEQLGDMRMFGSKSASEIPSAITGTGGKPVRVCMARTGPASGRLRRLRPCASGFVQVAGINNVAPDTFDPGHKMLHPSDMSGHKVLYT